MSSGARLLFGVICGMVLSALAIFVGPQTIICGLIVLFVWGIDQICEAIRRASGR